MTTREQGCMDRLTAIREWFSVDQAHCRPPRTEAVDPKSLIPIAGRIVLIRGPSGAGKTTLLRAMRRAAIGRRWLDLARQDIPARAVVECLGRMGLADALSLLAQVGLAEAPLFVRRATRLSAGQRDRLRLAMTLSRVSEEARETVIAADEFAAVLDRVTAAVLAIALRRAVDRFPMLSAVVATGHDDVTRALRPDRIVHCDFGAYSVEDTCRH